MATKKRMRIRERVGMGAAIEIARAACVPKSGAMAAVTRIYNWGADVFEIVAHEPIGDDTSIVTFSLNAPYFGQVCRLSPRALEDILNELGFAGEKICYRWS